MIDDDDDDMVRVVSARGLGCSVSTNNNKINIFYVARDVGPAPL